MPAERDRHRAGPQARKLTPVTWIAGLTLFAVVAVGLAAAARMSSGTRVGARAAAPSVTPTPQVITLLSPDSASARHDTTSALPQSLPSVRADASGGYLAPGAPSSYELQLIASLGAPDKVIVVSLHSQTMHVYANGAFLAGTYVVTGRPQLPTPRGVYQILNHIAPATLYSPWPPGSPFWYPPTPVNYTMEFRLGGFLIHDAPWHTVWGPGMNDWHYDPGAHAWQWGSHGCVGAPTPFVKWLYAWAGDGTTVVIY